MSNGILRKLAPPDVIEFGEDDLELFDPDEDVEIETGIEEDDGQLQEIQETKPEPILNSKDGSREPEKKPGGNRGKDVRVLADELIEKNFSEEEKKLVSKIFELFHNVYYKRLSDNILKKLKSNIVDGTETPTSKSIGKNVEKEQLYLDLLMKLIVLMR